MLSRKTTSKGIKRGSAAGAGVTPWQWVQGVDLSTLLHGTGQNYRNTTSVREKGPWTGDWTAGTSAFCEHQTKTTPSIHWKRSEVTNQKSVDSQRKIKENIHVTISPYIQQLNHLLDEWARQNFPMSGSCAKILKSNDHDHISAFVFFSFCIFVENNYVVWY